MRHTNKISICQKYKGCIVGSAIGDALGMQTEGLSREKIKAIFQATVKDYGRAPPLHPNHKLNPGQYTDDTEQLILLAESILEAEGFEVKTFSKKIEAWGRKIVENPEFNRLVGPTSIRAIKNMISGAKWDESGVDSDSCGSAMRAAPIGLLSYDVGTTIGLARMSSLPTHTSRGGIAGAAAIALGVSMNMQEVPVPEIVPCIVSEIKKIDQHLAERMMRLAKDKIQALQAEDFFGDSGVSNSVYETVPAAFFVFIRHVDSFEDAMVAAINGGGDTDSVACMAGALLGARLGLDAIPHRWRDRLENREYLESLAVKLFYLSKDNLQI